MKNKFTNLLDKIIYPIIVGLIVGVILLITQFKTNLFNSEKNINTDFDSMSQKENNNSFKIDKNWEDSLNVYSYPVEKYFSSIFQTFHYNTFIFSENIINNSSISYLTDTLCNSKILKTKKYNFKDLIFEREGNFLSIETKVENKLIVANFSNLPSNNYILLREYTSNKKEYPYYVYQFLFNNDKKYYRLFSDYYAEEGLSNKTDYKFGRTRLRKLLAEVFDKLQSNYHPEN